MYCIHLHLFYSHHRIIRILGLYHFHISTYKCLNIRRLLLCFRHHITSRHWLSNPHRFLGCNLCCIRLRLLGCRHRIVSRWFCCCRRRWCLWNSRGLLIKEADFGGFFHGFWARSWNLWLVFYRVLCSHFCILLRFHIFHFVFKFHSVFKFLSVFKIHFGRLRLF